MIKFKELIQGNLEKDIPASHISNLNELLVRINKIRVLWAKPMIVTSGYRSMSKHLEIYSKINADRKKLGLEPSKVPMGSLHLSGEAVDISDQDGKLYDWVFANTKILEEIGLWCEIKDTQKRVHFQIKSPKSGKRFFKP